MAPTLAPCTSQTQLCRSCARKRGCWDCEPWECAGCEADTWTVARFVVYWEDHDPDVREDVYGRRGRCPQQALDLKRCYGCMQKFCIFGCEACSQSQPVSSAAHVDSGVQFTHDSSNHASVIYEQCENVLCNKFCCRRPEVQMKTTGCERCQYAMDRASDFEIGPVDRSKVCRSCFYTYPQECGCGEFSWDPFLNIYQQFAST